MSPDPLASRSHSPRIRMSISWPCSIPHALCGSITLALHSMTFPSTTTPILISRIRKDNKGLMRTAGCRGTAAVHTLFFVFGNGCCWVLSVVDCSSGPTWKTGVDVRLISTSTVFMLSVSGRRAGRPDRTLTPLV